MAYFDADMDTEPVFDRMDTEYTIYVNNLPLELDEVAIKEVFNQYGKISGIFYPRNATWAYITYKSYCEAEHALRELNDKKPLYLKVALAKEKCVIKEEKLPKSYVLLESFEGRPKAIDTLAESPVSIHNVNRHRWFCENLAPVDNAGNYSSIIREKILELIQKNYPIIKIKIVEYDGGDYKIELPDIKNALIEEGLIPSS